MDLNETVNCSNCINFYIGTIDSSDTITHDNIRDSTIVILNSFRGLLSIGFPIDSSATLMQSKKKLTSSKRN